MVRTEYSVLLPGKNREAAAVDQRCAEGERRGFQEQTAGNHKPPKGSYLSRTGYTASDKETL